MTSIIEKYFMNYQPVSINDMECGILPYAIDGKSFDSSFLYSFFEEANIPFIYPNGDYHLGFNFEGFNDSKIFRIGNAGMMSRYILKNYMKEDYDYYINKFFNFFVNINAFIGIKIDNKSKTNCVFQVKKSATSLKDINSFTINFTCYRNNVPTLFPITIDFNNQTYYEAKYCPFSKNKYKGTLTISIDYNNPELFTLAFIDFYKKEFCSKLEIDISTDVNDIYKIYQMYSI